MPLMALDKGWRIVIRFAVAGFAVAFLTGVGYFWRPLRVLGFLVLASPGIWFFPELAWHDRPSSVFLLVVAPVLNCALYAIFGALVAGLTTSSKDN
jgi:predicted membrane channel-forming protein YqfA (hemolysin III family)